MKKLILNEELFLEGKNLEKTFNQYKSKLPYVEDEDNRELFNRIMAWDPTYISGGSTTGDFGIWLLNQYAKKNIQDDSYFEAEPEYGQWNSVTDLLQDFIDKKSNLEKKDINQYKTPTELYQVLKNVELSDRQKERKIRKDVKGAKKVGSTANFDIYIPETYEASCALGKGSGWCTADSRTRQYYDYYKDQYGGNYYIIISKDGKWKYQVHFESDQYSAAGTNPDINRPNDEEMIEFNDIIEKWPELKETLYELKSAADPAIVIRDILSEEIPDLISLKLSLEDIDKYIQVHNGIKQWFISSVDEIPQMRVFLALQNDKNAFGTWTKIITRITEKIKANGKYEPLNSDELWECTYTAFQHKLLKRIQQLKEFANSSYLRDKELSFGIFYNSTFRYYIPLNDLVSDLMNSNQGQYLRELVKQKKYDDLHDLLSGVFPIDETDLFSNEAFKNNVLRFTAGRLSNALDKIPSLCKAYFSNENILVFFFEDFEDELMDAIYEKNNKD